MYVALTNFLTFRLFADFAYSADFVFLSFCQKYFLILHCHNFYILFHLSCIGAEMLRIYKVGWVWVGIGMEISVRTDSIEHLLQELNFPGLSITRGH